MVERPLIHLKWVGERLWFDSTPGDWSRPVKQQGPYYMRWRVMRRQVRFLGDQPPQYEKVQDGEEANRYDRA